jgi:uncharacterized protein with HEPN domain
MPPESRKLLLDMQDAATEITTITAGQSVAWYVANRPVRWSVERGFEIIGEALSQLRKIDVPRAERITDFRKIISFRNVLIHGYGAINDQTTWDIVQNDLPLLRKELDELLKEP